MNTLPNDHDHTKCVASALLRATQLCEKRGLRLTSLRKQVLELVWQSHTALGAYTLMEMLQAHSDRKRVAPPTVYRALDFLVENGLIHKVHSANAFIGCRCPQEKHSDTLFICTQCGFTTEVSSASIQQAVNLCASQQRFTVKSQVLEIVGICAACREPHE